MRLIKTTSSSLTPLFLLLLFISLSGIISCSKTSSHDSSLVQQSDTTITDSTIFIDITLNNSRLLGVQNSSAGPYYWSTLTGYLPVDTLTYGYNRIGSIFTFQGLTQPPGFFFGKGNYGNILALSNTTLLPANFVDSFFAPGNYNYSIKGNDTSFNFIGTSTDTILIFPSTETKTLLTPGINIIWNDANGTNWETCKGTADQAGSYFTITSVKVIQAVPLACVITANFACKLYDGNGNVINLTNGRFRLISLL